MGSRRTFPFLASVVVFLACACSLGDALIGKPAGISASTAHTFAPTTASASAGNASTAAAYFETVTPTAPGPISGKAGEIIMDGDLRFFVHGWKESDVDDSGTSSLKNGNRLISIEYSVVYAGGDSYSISDGKFSLLDAASGTIPYDPSLEEYDNFATQADLYPGEKARLTMAFEVPKESSNFSLYFSDPYDGSLAEATISLSEQPGWTEPTGPLPGEIAPPVTAAGSQATCDQWQLRLFRAYRKPAQDLADTPRNGWLLTFLELSVKNLSANSRKLNGGFWLQDVSGRRYLPDVPAFDQASGFSDVENLKYGPQEEIRGVLGFDLPPDPDSMHLVFWCGYWESTSAGDKVTTGDKATLAIPPWEK